jgi:hypothetical protein
MQRPARVPQTVAQVGDLLEALLQSLLSPQKPDKLRKLEWILEAFDASTASLNFHR